MVQIFPIRSIFSNQVPKAKSISSHQNDDNADTVVPYLPTIVIPRNLVEPIDDNLQNLNSSFIIYSQTVGFHTQTGICAALSIDNYSNGVLKRHENTVNGFELCFHAKEFTLPSPSSSSSSCRTQSNVNFYL